ncbi:heat shock protein beta-6-like [Oppia nitens]|uniref:heat shock protein beta-6-like n=1 Tax=Oppia nitens TaxID=1686743 RepID=UPI0023DAFE84|nr:heat shock protein beta-6-like [Oppia nitens]
MSLSLYCPHRWFPWGWEVKDGLTGDCLWPSITWSDCMDDDCLDNDGNDDGWDLRFSRRRIGSLDISNNGRKFTVRVNCRRFRPEEISVKTVGQCLVIKAKHREWRRACSHEGWLEKEFCHKYDLPDGADPQRVTSRLDTCGILTIEAPIDRKPTTTDCKPIKC